MAKLLWLLSKSVSFLFLLSRHYSSSSASSGTLFASCPGSFYPPSRCPLLLHTCVFFFRPHRGPLTNKERKEQQGSLPLWVLSLSKPMWQFHPPLSLFCESFSFFTSKDCVCIQNNRGESHKDDFMRRS